MGTILKLKYAGKSSMSFTTGKIYTAKKMKDGEYGNEGFAVFDDDGKWFAYAWKFIQENFQVLKQDTTIE